MICRYSVSLSAFRRVLSSFAVGIVLLNAPATSSFAQTQDGNSSAQAGQERSQSRSNRRATEAEAPDGGEARSQPRSSTRRTANRPDPNEQANRKTVFLMAANLTGTFLTLANDVSLVLNAEDRVRVLPVVGQGADQNVRDVLKLKGVDLALTFADTLEVLRRSGEIPDLDQRLRYVTMLPSSDILVITRKEIRAFRELAGKKVAADVAGSGANLSARFVFAELKMGTTVLDMDFAKSLDMLRKGEIDGVYKSAIRPNGSVAALTGAAAEGLHLIPVPFDPRIGDAYLPSIVPATVYPGLADPGAASLATIATPAVLVAFNWAEGTDRYDRVANFVEAFFDRFAELQKAPRHSSWKDVNLAAELPGWTRFKAAEKWLDRNRAGSEDDARQSFEQFLSGKGVANLSSAERQKLFREYQSWAKQRGQ